MPGHSRGDSNSERAGVPDQVEPAGGRMMSFVTLTSQAPWPMPVCHQILQGGQQDSALCEKAIIGSSVNSVNHI